jgi:hypothetical protein
MCAGEMLLWRAHRRLRPPSGCLCCSPVGGLPYQVSTAEKKRREREDRCPSSSSLSLRAPLPPLPPPLPARRARFTSCRRRAKSNARRAPAVGEEKAGGGEGGGLSQNKTKKEKEWVLFFLFSRARWVVPKTLVLKSVWTHLACLVEVERRAALVLCVCGVADRRTAGAREEEDTEDCRRRRRHRLAAFRVFCRLWQNNNSAVSPSLSLCVSEHMCCTGPSRKQKMRPSLTRSVLITTQKESKVS